LHTALTTLPFVAGQTVKEGNMKIILSHYDGIPKTEKPSPESDMEIVFPIKISK
jgi:hypothetical protein